MKKVSLVKLLQLSAGGSPEFDNNHLDFVNYLLECWHRGENVVLIDDQVCDQLLFVLGLPVNLLLHICNGPMNGWCNLDGDQMITC